MGLVLPAPLAEFLESQLLRSIHLIALGDVVECPAD